MEADRSCNWVGIWYPDDPTHFNAMERLQQEGYSFAGILHDRDVDENGELKKPHWHVVISFRYQKTATAVAKLFGIAPNYVQPASSKVGALRYLLHLDDPDKFQYEHSEVFGVLASQIPTNEEKPSENEQVTQLLALLDTLPVPCTYTHFLKSACNADLYACFRRMGVGACRLLDDHNYGASTAHPQVEADFRAYVQGFEDGHSDGSRQNAFRLACMKRTRYSRKDD